MATPVFRNEVSEPAGQSSPERGGSLDSKAYFWMVVAGLTAGYFIVAVFLAIHRFVWFDEFFTYDIARASNLHQLWEWSLKFDNNPPLSYLLSRFSMHLFGPTALGLRFPSILGFYFGSVAIFLYARRKAGVAIAALAVLLLCGRATFYYATEARVYAVIFMAWAWLLLSWDTAIRSKQRKLAIFGVAVSNCVLLSAHVFGPLTLFPFIVAEAVRFRRRRKPDYALWAALLAPCLIMLAYIPLIRAFGNIIVPADSMGSWRTAVLFYSRTLRSIALASFIAIPILLVLLAIQRSRIRPSKLSPEDWTVFLCLFLNPVLLSMVLMVKHGVFADRYCFTTSIVICLAAALLIARYLKPILVIWGIAAVAIALGLAAQSLLASKNPASSSILHRMDAAARNRLAHWRRAQLDPIPWASVRPDLPIVVGHGNTFDEMNHHDGPKVLDRLYYLENRSASLKYAHKNYFEDFENFTEMKKAGFPIRANVESYASFIRAHRQFLVFGEIDPEEWVMHQLLADGASTKPIHDYVELSPYVFDHHIYLVTMPDSHSEKSSDPHEGAKTPAGF